MMKRSHERPLVESSKLLDHRQQSCAIHNVKVDSARLKSKVTFPIVTKLGHVVCAGDPASL